MFPLTSFRIFPEKMILSYVFLFLMGSTTNNNLTHTHNGRSQVRVKQCHFGKTQVSKVIYMGPCQSLREGSFIQNVTQYSLLASYVSGPGFGSCNRATEQDWQGLYPMHPHYSIFIFLPYLSIRIHSLGRGRLWPIRVSFQSQYCRV